MGPRPPAEGQWRGVELGMPSDRRSVHDRSLVALLALGALAGLLTLTRSAAATPTVWAIDDGEKIKRDATALPFQSGAQNPVWSPGQPIRLCGLRDETVALQIVVQADANALTSVTVDLDALDGPNGAHLRNSSNDPLTFLGRPIERFVEHYFDIQRASGNTADATNSLGWAGGSGPPAGAWTGLIPDALIPIESAPAWSPYPMTIAANQNGVVWIDLTIPRDQPAGLYTGQVVVKAGTAPLATLPVELTIIAATLPARPVKTMLFYDPGELGQRIGSSGPAEQNLWKLLHRHRLTPMHSVSQPSELASHLPALEGSLYTRQNGYDGPGAGLGDDVLSLGTYGSYGAPDRADLTAVEGIADLLASHNLFPTTDVFVYAIDETCSSPYGMQWKTLLGSSSDPNVRNIRVGWTCSTNPSQQPVDVPIVFAGQFDPTTAAAARAAGKAVWIYNGYRPHTGSFLTDAPAVELRANGWVAALFDIGRWFYWETTFWYDGNPGGLGPFDPFVTAETFHNNYGDYCEGDGVLLYPGKQVDLFTTHSVGLDGVIASIRLKNLRRGIQDAGIYQLAHVAQPAQAESIARALLPRVLADARDGDPPSWSQNGQAFFSARKMLIALVRRDPGPPPDGGAGDGGPGADAGPGAGGGATGGGCGCAVAQARSPAPAGLPLLAVLAVARTRSRRPRPPHLLPRA